MAAGRMPWHVQQRKVDVWQIEQRGRVQGSKVLKDGFLMVNITLPPNT